MLALPVELIEEILMLAADSPSTAFSFLLISRWAFPLAERLLYERVVLHGDVAVAHFLSCHALRSPGARLPHESTKSLHLSGPIPPAHVIKVISACPGVRNLVQWIDANGLMMHQHITPHNPFQPYGEEGSHIFHSLTHLDLNNCAVLDRSTLGLEHLVGLTHLSLPIDARRTSIKMLRRILRLPNLKVLVLRVNEARGRRIEQFLQSNHITDSRIVLADGMIPQWGSMGRGDMAFWDEALKVVQSPHVNTGVPRWFSRDRMWEMNDVPFMEL
ncbi:hypothetical protein DFH29DRAFT_1009367 [Suillus ampliporus]|nr:hypothetical protein DFH29DRAFT_1009367 [Suillus ampliporus]